MRIKKKNLILEALLIDKIDEFTPQEKRLLNVLHKKFGMGSGKLEKSWDFDKWAAAAYLIEFFEVPYDVAHSLSSTYYWNGEKLFKEYEPIRKHDNRSDLFMNHVFRQVLDPYIEGKSGEDANYFINAINYNVKTQNDNETLPGIVVQTFEPRTHSQIEESQTEVNEVKLNVRPIVWSSYNGITLYIQATDDNSIVEPKDIIRTNWTTLRNMGLMVYLKLSPYNEDDPKSNEFVKSEISFRFGDENQYNGIISKEDLKLPKILSKENIITFIDMLVEKTRSAVNGRTFIYGKGEKKN
tara:strand:- start:1421 stop:2311 length:891 start_codon:yes stop_codon:yes gene_type:complete